MSHVPQKPGPRPTVPVTIDGREVKAHEGETILSLARREGIPIPTLCQLDGLSIHGGCRLCVVQVEGEHKLPLACATEVSAEMEVRTDTPQLLEHRQTIVSLLFAEGSHVCAFCVASGGCELQDLAADLGLDHLGYELTFPRHEVDASHPKFVFDRDRCVLCTRCVRVCAEVEGAFVWDVAMRGNEAHVVSGLDEPWGDVAACTWCGKCVSVCPTGALAWQGTAAGELRTDPSVVSFLVRARDGAWHDPAQHNGTVDEPADVDDREEVAP